MILLLFLKWLRKFSITVAPAALLQPWQQEQATQEQGWRAGAFMDEGAHGQALKIRDALSSGGGDAECKDQKAEQLGLGARLKGPPPDQSWACTLLSLVFVPKAPGGQGLGGVSHWLTVLCAATKPSETPVGRGESDRNDGKGNSGPEGRRT